MSIIYNPSGRAKEYAPGVNDRAANLYMGCSHKCRYCYAADVLRMDKEKFNNSPSPKVNVLDKLETSARSYKRKGQSLHVLLSFVCDDYQPLDAETGITREAIKILHKYDHTVCILTKGGTRALRDIDLFIPGDVFACTLTCLDVGDSLRWEPGAATPYDRLVALKEFHKAGIRTWVSLEPTIRPEWSLKWIKYTHDIVDLYKIGTLNYSNKLPVELKAEVQDIDWHKYARNAIELLENLGKVKYIKEDLAEYL